MKSKRFRLTLSNHCIHKIMAHGWNFKDLKYYIDMSCWPDNLSQEDDKLLLRVETLKGSLILNKAMDTAITFIADNQLKGDTGTVKGAFRYQQKYACNIDMRLHIKNGEFFRILMCDDGRIAIKTDRGIVGYAKETYNSGFGDKWTTALGKLFTEDFIDGDVWVIEFRKNCDKHGCRVRLFNGNNEPMGKMKTAEDATRKKLENN